MSLQEKQAGEPEALLPGADDHDRLPSNISSRDQLSSVPEECLSDDDSRPLLHIDESGNRFKYALQPTRFSVIFILIVELLERFSFY
mmetsp:Transcript_37529/g.77865  ORF Transcript_37529/g.77865 Transcript_37529/m.77865 type:complete len:87 (+) Transcript_37529:205-465(+)